MLKVQIIHIKKCTQWRSWLWSQYQPMEWHCGNSVCLCMYQLTYGWQVSCTCYFTTLRHKVFKSHVTAISPIWDIQLASLIRLFFDHLETHGWQVSCACYFINLRLSIRKLVMPVISPPGDIRLNGLMNVITGVLLDGFLCSFRPIGQSSAIRSRAKVSLVKKSYDVILRRTYSCPT